MIWVIKMLYDEFVPKRVTELRMSKGVSARDMSLSIGQNESYINRIENGASLPSLAGLHYICEYFGITYAEFFDEGNVMPGRLRELNERLRKLTPAQIDAVMAVVSEFEKEHKK